jgi:hypothetical protein
MHAKRLRSTTSSPIRLLDGGRSDIRRVDRRGADDSSSWTGGEQTTVRAGQEGSRRQFELDRKGTDDSSSCMSPFPYTSRKHQLIG